MAGPFSFAWVDPTDNVFLDSFIREDEEVLDFTIGQVEGDFASMSLTIRNPRIGLLAPGRKVWAWFAFNKGSESEPDARPMFFGRVIGMPEDIDGETVKLSFLARPEDFLAQKVVLAETLKERPYWDPIWFSPDTLSDPDNVLESRAALWHIDRTTLEVSISDILIGEDGVIARDESQVFYDSVHVSYGDVPARRVDVNASVSWNQNVTGNVNFSVYTMFGAVGSLQTYTGDGLLKSWPKSGAGIGGGWTVGDSHVERVGSVMNAVWSDQDNPEDRGARASMHKIPLPSGFGWNFFIPKWVMAPTLTANYNTSRKYTETVIFSLSADVQSILTEPGDEDGIALTLSSSEIVSPIDPGGALPIGDVRYPTFFAQARGAQSLEYLICLARAMLLARARTVTISVEIPFMDAIDLDITLRKSFVLTDARMPGGQAAGKIIEYEFSGDGASGAFVCMLKVGCSIGKGNTVEAVAGTPTYAEEGYMEEGYQRYDGTFIMPITNEVTYEDITGLPPNDDGIDFFHMNAADFVVPEGSVNTGGWPEQQAAMDAAAQQKFVRLDPNLIYTALNAIPTTFNLTLRPVTGGPFVTIFTPAVSDLMVPKTIDLEAPSS